MSPPSDVFSICGAGAICSIGYCLDQIWAAIRADISQFGHPGLVNTKKRTLRMAVLPEADLEPEVPENANLSLSARERRMLCLAAPAIREATSSFQFARPLPLFLGYPAGNGDDRQPWPSPSVLQAMGQQAGIILDLGRSKILDKGRASFFLALAEAMRFLATGGEAAIVGGVDTFFDQKLLFGLLSEKRILDQGVADGFIPGEGAAFVVIRRMANAPVAGTPCVIGIGLSQDPGHRHSQEPARGEGLSSAIEALLGANPKCRFPVQTVFCGLNGESFGVKEWAVARIRHASLFAQGMKQEGPADCHGDLGAATGAMLFALAETALRRQHRASPIFIWASSDHEERGCALIDSMNQ